MGQGNPQDDNLKGGKWTRYLMSTSVGFRPNKWIMHDIY